MIYLITRCNLQVQVQVKLSQEQREKNQLVLLFFKLCQLLKIINLFTESDD